MIKMNKDILYDDRFKLYVVIGTLLVVIFSLTFLYANEGRVKKNSISDYSDYFVIYESDQNRDIIGNIEDIEIGRYISISGWIFKRDEKINIYKCHVCLEDFENRVVYELPTRMVEWPDVSKEYGMEENDYNRSGYYGYALSRLVNVYNSKLEVVILYENDNNKIYYHTNQYMENGECL